MIIPTIEDLYKLCALACLGVALLGAPEAVAEPFAVLDDAGTTAGYLARLLINEVPFPGEHGYVSEEDSCAGMLAILWVLHGRIHHVPVGYTQKDVAAVVSTNILDVITAGGERGQCDGFYRDATGKCVYAKRVGERVTYLLSIANKGGAPGRFSRMINYAQTLARTYVKSGIKEADRYASLKLVGQKRVTGRAYGWMSDNGYYSPGGWFLGIPNQFQGALGGNRFFTLLWRSP